MIFVSISYTRVRYKTISFPFIVGQSWKDPADNDTSASAVWSRDVHDGRWYNFSRPPLFVFYVYSAFLVQHEPQDVVRLVSITSSVELFVRRRLDVFCVVRYPDRRLPHVASILRRPPRRISEPGRVGGYQVGDYVYSCPLPDYRQDRVPVSTMASRINFYSYIAISLIRISDITNSK